MTQAPVATEQAFKADFNQVGALIGGTTLAMTLAFEPAELGKWTASGSAKLTRGSTNPPLDLDFPMVGELTFNPTSQELPKQYNLDLHSEFPDGRVGIGLSVRLTELSEMPPSVAAKLTWTGEYTWLQGPPVTVDDVTVEMTNLSL